MEGINSKDRVKDFGEVYTPDSTVVDMIDLMNEHFDSIDTKELINETWLEPACGNGQILIRILDLKIKAVNKIPEKEREKWFIKALSTIYGVDIQPDNVMESRKRMLSMIDNEEVQTYDTAEKLKRPFNKLDLELSDNLRKVINFILDTNIQCGDTLKNEKYDFKYFKRTGKATIKGEPKQLVMTDYIFDMDTETVRMEDYSLADIEIKINEYEPINYTQLNKRKSLMNTDDFLGV